MGVPFFLLMASVAGVIAAWAAQSPELLMVAGPAMLGSLWLWLKAFVLWLERRMRQGEPSAFEPAEPDGAPRSRFARPSRRVLPRRPKRPPKLIVVDGSNVMYWKDNTPHLATLLEVLRALEARGYSPGVVFDANAGYILAGRYLHHNAFSRLLHVPEERVMVAHKGEPADKTVLAAARDFGVRVVSNDRFRDWAAEFPEVANPSHFLRGNYRDGVLWLQPEPAADPVTA